MSRIRVWCSSNGSCLFSTLGLLGVWFGMWGDCLLSPPPPCCCCKVQSSSQLLSKMQVADLTVHRFRSFLTLRISLELWQHFSVSTQTPHIYIANPGYTSGGTNGRIGGSKSTRCASLCQTSWATGIPQTCRETQDSGPQDVCVAVLLDVWESCGHRLNLPAPVPSADCACHLRFIACRC